MRMLAHKSDSQANAEALTRRSASYADEHAASWQVRFDRPTHEPRNLREYTRDLRGAYEAECPSRLHRHDVDAGGTPAMTAAFEQWLWGSPFAIDHESGSYATPLRATLAGMTRGELATRHRARIAYRIVTGTDAVQAAIAEGAPEWCAKVVARDALQVTWRRLVTSPLPLAKSDAIA